MTGRVKVAAFVKIAERRDSALIKEWRVNTPMEIQRETAKDLGSRYIGKEIDREVHLAGRRTAIVEIQRARAAHAYEFDLFGEGIA
jgi:ribosomal protein S12 methylthiotransferase